MDDELLDYYTRELSYLREMGAEFAHAYPRVAGRLLLEADKCEDPHVERILEGVAFLTARIRKKLDDQYPEVTDSLLNLVFPHAVRPLPSLSIAQLVPATDRSKLVAGFPIPPGTALNSRPVGGVACTFRTAYPVMLWPVRVAEARLYPDRVPVPDKPAQAQALLHLTLKTEGEVPFGQLPLDRLRFYLDGDAPLAFALHEWLFNDVCAVRMRTESATNPRERRASTAFTLGCEAIRPVGYEADEGLVPYPARSFVGYRLLQEYLAFPEKFLFFDLSGLECLRKREEFGETLEVQIFLDRSPKGNLQVSADNFRLYCTPVVNLTSKVCSPIRLNQTASEYPIIPDLNKPLAYEVHSVDSVSSVGSYLEEAVPYRPFYAPRPDGTRESSTAYWYSTRRPSSRRDDGGSDVWLSFVDLGFSPRRPAVETITVHALCTNRDLPAKLPFGGEQGDFTLDGQAPVARVRCLRRPTRPLRPPLGRNAQWRLISHMALNHQSLTEGEGGLEALRELLKIYDYADNAVSRQQVEGILGLSSRRVTGRVGRPIGNTMVLGLEVTLTFDESHYVGNGAFLFASVLERFLALYTSINSFTQLVAKSKQREGVWKRWAPRAGDRTLL